MVHLTINGRPIQAESGASVLQSALAAGIYVPHVCYHPDLSVAGQCRLCMVDCSGKGVVPACTMTAFDGLAVETETAEVQALRRTNMSLLLEGYQGDCETCARSGHCTLQAAALHIGVPVPRGAGRPVRGSDESNPFFTLRHDQCVLCGICIRTCDEIQGACALELAGHGVDVRIASGGVPLAQSRCESCGECVSRCPAGGLMPKVSAALDREVRTVCVYCGVGCSLYLGVRDEQVVSVRGATEGSVNQGRLCVKGRYGFGFIHSPERLASPMVRRNGVLEPASWEEALSLVATRLGGYAPHEVAVIGSSRCTNEETYLTQKLARAVLHTNNIDNCARLCHAPTVTGLASTFGAGGGTSQLSDIGLADCIFVIGSNTTAAHAVAGSAIRRATRRAALIVADPRVIDLAATADLHLPLRPGTDVALLTAMARVIMDEGLHDRSFVADRCEGFETFAQRVAECDVDEAARITGVPVDRIAAAARLYATRKPSLIVYSLGITEHTHGTDNVKAIANLALLTGNVGRPGAGVMPMRGQNNVQGACDMGCLPNAFPGSQKVADPAVRAKFEAGWGVRLPGIDGLGVVEMMQKAGEGEVKALYIVGMDPAYSVADARQVQGALHRAEFVVIQDIMLTGSCEFADVLLPAAGFAEKDGTFTNLERRVQLVRKAIDPVGDSRPDWQILCDVARRMGAAGFDYDGPAEIMAEMASLTPSYAGMSFERLAQGGIQWPCPAPDHPGTPRLHTSTFGTTSGKGRFCAISFRPSAEAADDDYPIILTTGRSLYHFHLAMTSQVQGLVELMPRDLVWVHPEDAERLGIQEGDPVTISSRRGALEAPATITDRVMPGNAFMTFHYYKTPTNVLTAQAVDPEAGTPEFKVTAVRIARSGAAAHA